MYYSIIDTHFDGELIPWELAPASGKHGKREGKFEELCQRFQENLCPKQQTDFERIMEDFSKIWCSKSRDMFYTGFCLGSRIMMEVMQFEER